MKVFISGPSVGKLDALKESYLRAEKLLLDFGHKPVNIFNINPNAFYSLPSRMEILSECNAILLLEGWIQSPESRVEKYFCENDGRKILFQSRLECSQSKNYILDEKVSRIKDAIYQTTGLIFEEYKGGTRGTNKAYYARLLFSHFCYTLGLSPRETILYLERDLTTILHHLSKYKIEYRFNPKFKKIADRSEEILNKNKDGSFG